MKVIILTKINQTIIVGMHTIARINFCECEYKTNFSQAKFVTLKYQ